VSTYPLPSPLTPILKGLLYRVVGGDLGDIFIYVGCDAFEYCIGFTPSLVIHAMQFFSYEACIDVALDIVHVREDTKYNIHVNAGLCCLVSTFQAGFSSHYENSFTLQYFQGVSYGIPFAFA